MPLGWKNFDVKLQDLDLKMFGMSWKPWNMLKFQVLKSVAKWFSLYSNMKLIWCVCLPYKTMAKTMAWLIFTTFSPAFVSGLVPSLAMTPALGPYFCVRYWIRGTPLSGVVGFRKNGFHVTSKSKSLENTFMASSRWRFPTKHLRKEQSDSS